MRSRALVTRRHVEFRQLPAHGKTVHLSEDKVARFRKPCIK